MSDGNSKQGSDKGSSWLQAEYEALLETGESVSESFFKLAQLTFVLNPAIALAFAYVVSEGNFKHLKFVAVPIVAIAIIYNMGAFANYLRLQERAAYLFVRLVQIEINNGGRMLYQFRQMIPWWYQKHRVLPILKRDIDAEKIEALRLDPDRRPRSLGVRIFDVHTLTVFFFLGIILAWIACVVLYLSGFFTEPKTFSC